MEGNIKWIDFDTMENFMIDVFKGVGVPEEDAKICADVLIEADKQGIDSHGANRLKPFYYDRIVGGIQLFPETNFEVVREGPTTAVVDGHHGMGMVIGKRSMEMAIQKAKKYGMGMVVVRNSTHYGIAGYYCDMAVKAGMIGISGTNARPSIAPTLGVENMLGTNPLTFGMPSDDGFPFMLDCATSIAQRGKIEVYDKLGKKMPEGWVIDENGNHIIDPHRALEDLMKGSAALNPLGGAGEELGGYKGYGYATVVEILSAALQGGSFLKALSGVRDGKKVTHGLGHFFIAIDISAFTELEDFKKTTGDILRELRGSKKAQGQDRIYTAGEKEHETRLYRKDKGVPVNQKSLEELIAMRDELGLDGYEF